MDPCSKGNARCVGIRPGGAGEDLEAGVCALHTTGVNVWGPGGVRAATVAAGEGLAVCGGEWCRRGARRAGSSCHSVLPRWALGRHPRRCHQDDDCSPERKGSHRDDLPVASVPNARASSAARGCQPRVAAPAGDSARRDSRQESHASGMDRRGASGAELQVGAESTARRGDLEGLQLVDTGMHRHHDAATTQRAGPFQPELDQLSGHKALAPAVSAAQFSHTGSMSHTASGTTGTRRRSGSARRTTIQSRLEWCRTDCGVAPGLPII